MNAVFLLFTILAVRCQLEYLDILTYQGIRASPCTRITNDQNGPTGCTGNGQGSIGVLYGINSSADIDQFLSISSSILYPNIAIVMPRFLFTNENLEKIERSGKVAGILLSREDLPAGLTVPSDDLAVPNQAFGLYANSTKPRHPWNLNGTGLLYKSFNFPIMEIDSLMGKTTASRAIFQALLFNRNAGFKTFPLYGIQFEANMWSGSTDSSTCLRRGFCGPIGEYSVWSTFSADIQRNDSKPIVMVTSRFDGNAFIHDLASSSSWRANAAVLMTIVDALRPFNTSQLPKHLVFSLFGAESWSFAGSQRFVQDLSKEFVCQQKTSQHCPFSNPACGNPCTPNLDFRRLDFEAISSVIDLDVGGLLFTNDPGLDVYYHVDQYSAEIGSIGSTLQFFSGNVTGFNGSSSTTLTFKPAFTSSNNLGLPPSSAMSFLMKKNIPAVLLADYSTKFSNPFYSTEYDDGSTWGNDQITRLCGIAGGIAKSLYVIAGGSLSLAPGITADCGRLQEYMYCMTRNFSCPLMQQLFPTPTDLPTFVRSYSGEFSFGALPSYLTFFISRMMANSTAGARLGTCVKDSECLSFLCISGQCVTSMTRLHDAYGTGLEFNHDSGQWHVVDTTQGTWTESTWDYTRARIFLVPSVLSQGLQFGFAVLLNFSIALIAFFWSRIKIFD